MKSYIICTEYKGVFYGELPDDADISNRKLLGVKNGVMCIYWRNEKGVMGLASDGPDEKCKLGKMADIPVLHNVTALFEVTKEAKEKWLSMSK